MNICPVCGMPLLEEVIQLADDDTQPLYLCVWPECPNCGYELDLSPTHTESGMTPRATNNQGQTAYSAIDNGLDNPPGE